MERSNTIRSMKITDITGLEYPGLLLGGVLYDSRTGEKATGDKWEPISAAEFLWLCDSWMIEN